MLGFPLGILSAAGAGGEEGAGAYDLIATSFGTGLTDSITFDVSTLSGTYKHLQIRAVAQTILGNTGISVRLNGDTGSNYSWHILFSNPPNVQSSNVINTTSMDLGFTEFNSVSTRAGVSVIDLLDPFSTTKNKTLRALNGALQNNEVGLRSGLYRSTSAVTSITVLASFPTANFTNISRFSLYGIKG